MGPSKSVWASNSLLTRILVRVVVLLTLVGLLTLALSYFYTTQQTRQQMLNNIEQLLNTVEPSLQVACFLNDQQLAGEVAKGLLSNDSVIFAGVYAYPESVLFEQSEPQGDLASEQYVSRTIYSPFDVRRKDIVGEVRVLLNEQAIAAQNYQSLINIAVPIFTQTLIALVALVLVIVLFLSPKIRKLMGQIKAVRADKGELLACPKDEQRSEIGVLVSYINGLIARMYKALHNERELRQQQEIQQQKYRSIFENARSCIFLVDDQGYITSKNQACKLCSVTQSFFSDSGPVALAQVLAPQDYELKYFIETMISEKREAHFEAYFPAQNSEQTDLWLQVNLTPIDDHSIQGVINDITKLKLETQTANEVARTDSLTQLANRLGFNDELARLLDGVATGQLSLAVLLVDLDRFKAVNDTYGHQAGDRVLMQVATGLRNSVRELDYIARLGGDEFVILLRNASMQAAERIAQDILSKLNQPFVLAEESQTVCIGASIGIVVVAQGDDISARELMHCADQKMYEMKRKGRNNYGFFKAGND